MRYGPKRSEYNLNISHAKDAWDPDRPGHESFHRADRGGEWWTHGLPGAKGNWRTAAPVGSVHHHGPRVMHALRTKDEPVLALYVWSGSVAGRYWFEPGEEQIADARARAELVWAANAEREAAAAAAAEEARLEAEAIALEARKKASAAAVKKEQTEAREAVRRHRKFAQIPRC